MTKIPQLKLKRTTQVPNKQTQKWNKLSKNQKWLLETLSIGLGSFKNVMNLEIIDNIKRFFVFTALCYRFIIQLSEAGREEEDTI